jgi:hypothetical protein
MVKQLEEMSGLTFENFFLTPFVDLPPPFLQDFQKLWSRDWPDSCHILANSAYFVCLAICADGDDIGDINVIGIALSHEFARVPINCEAELSGFCP